MNIANNSSSTADREIVAVRTFGAPRSLVFQMWTDPAHVGNWWGPNGFTNTIETMEVKPGGVWKFVMHGPDGIDYPNLITYLEVVQPEKLVYKHGSDKEDHPGDFEVTVLFTEENGNTKIEMRMLFKTAEQKNEVVDKYGAVEGLNQTMGRLREYLEKL
ncbi:ATPase [Leptospira gomenensis]|uniref:ATPase n=1 Tax=Leptospira gomenensis TaxID=2484974 RepID=A0A5F1YXY9_9LEPT|nr:SRPBCC family protein [Leptospira gomenensis]TGK29439.1 ATPase [Leptospira gomenensis]TGK33658.1 ATPase [Leptospira gomenensis]TGK44899.1 ATPase [Leptospira gomenensis]TGK64520.1 ATPase [Leptospira gomenensis]